MTRFWGDYLKRFKLWKQGRATHVARHTVAANLRAHGLSDQEIGAVLGHASTSVTAGYGGAMPLARKAEILSKIDYEIDLLEFLGGPFDPNRHL